MRYIKRGAHDNVAMFSLPCAQLSLMDGASSTEINGGACASKGCVASGQQCQAMVYVSSIHCLNYGAIRSTFEHIVQLIKEKFKA
jgi:hypothetical protein